MNDKIYSLTLSRGEVCDLLLACTCIVSGATLEMNDPECPEYRREHVLPETIKKWQTLHDKIADELTTLDANSEEISK